MPTLKARIKKGIPVCPECNKYTKGIKDYGVEDKKKNASYWFRFECDNCTKKTRKVFVRYFVNGDFDVVR